MKGNTFFFPVFGVLVFLVGMNLSCSNQSEPESGSPFAEVFTYFTTTNPDSAAVLADSLNIHSQIPHIENGHVLFLHHSNASSVAWRGDFDSWGRTDDDFSGIRIGNTDWWYKTATFPSDARLDYKIVENDEDWILDPANPNRQLGGAGYNSVIFMPDHKNSALVTTPTIRGQTSEPVRFNSAVMTDEIRYQIHYSPGFSPENPFGLMYVTDAHEYTHPELGNLLNTADTLATAGLIIPLKIILIDPRQPETGENLRAHYFVENENYPVFVATELISRVESGLEQTGKRAILGTSYGGFFATRLSLMYPEQFPNAIIQSPAFWPDYDLIECWKDVPVDTSRRFVVTSGSFYDGLEPALYFHEIIQEKFNAHMFQVNEGHSWGAWRNQLPDALMHIFGTQKAQSVVKPVVDPVE